jgi:hypothetical protein
VVLLLLGSFALLALLLDCFLSPAVFATWAGDEFILEVSEGGLWLGWQGAPFPLASSLNTELRSHWPELSFALPVWSFHSNAAGYWSYWVCAPMWMISLICLAWPVSSFIIARRRHKRGFPVVAPLPMGEVPSEPARASERSN